MRSWQDCIDLMYPLFANCSLCSLYNWRYTKLGDLPHVQTWPEYCVENPGFFFDYQLIDVPDFNGVGESEPNPYFYQVKSITKTVFVLRFVTADKLSLLPRSRDFSSLSTHFTTQGAFLCAKIRDLIKNSNFPIGKETMHLKPDYFYFYPFKPRTIYMDFGERITRPQIMI